MHSKTEKIFKILPSLRRYAQALSGTESATDDVLEGAIEWMIDNAHLDRKNFEDFGVAGCRIAWNDTTQANQELIFQNHDYHSKSEFVDAINTTQALNALSFSQRRCLIMFAVEQKSYREISALANVSMNQVAEAISQARIALVEKILTNSDSYAKQSVSSLEWCSDQHLNALLDNQLSPTEALKTRNALKFDEQLSHRLEQLALVDTLVVSHAIENDTTPFNNPLHAVVTQPSAYLH